MRLFFVLSLLFPSLALRLLHDGYSFIIPVIRRSQSSFNLSEPVDTEIQTLLVKYRGANEFIHAHLLSSAPTAGHTQSPISDYIPPFDFTGSTPIRPILSASTGAQAPLTDFVQNDLDILYSVEIKIGTPPQTFTVDVDTGSSDLFVASDCPFDQCGNHRQFNSHASTTFLNGGKNIKLTYGSGQADGDLGQDVVSIQGLSVRNQTFITVSSESSDFKDKPINGLIGMAFSSIAVSGSPTFFENLIQTRTIAKPEFSLYLTRDLVTGSELCLGCYNSAKAIGPSAYFPVVSKSYWTLKMDGLAVNSTQVPADEVVAVIDSGTTLIYVPAELAANFYGLIPGSKQVADMGLSFYSFPCDIQITPSIVFGGQIFRISMTDFNLGRLSGGSLDCIGGVMALPIGFPNNLAIVGDEFLKSWYTTFDYSGPRVGFAPSVNNGI